MQKPQNSIKETNASLKELKEIFLDLDGIVPIIDKIGSGFEDSERLSLALLLLFKERSVLQTLAKIRKFIHLELESKLSQKDLDDLIEESGDITFWKIPYSLTKDELLDRIKKES